MTANKKHFRPNGHPDQGSDSSLPDLKNLLLADSSLDEELDAVDVKVSEVAKEQAPKVRNDSASTSQTSHTAASSGDQTLEERLLLREKLLAEAPKPSQMRSEVRSVLREKETQVRRDIRKYSRTKNYELLSFAIAQLRDVFHQLDIVASAGYELLKEIWLKVVRQFAL